MKAHILTIGDEILIGQIINSNAAYIGEKLTQAHVHVNGSSVVGDDEEIILNEFKRVFDENDLILVTGGLGPTHDDVTRKCVMEFFNSELIVDKEVLSDIKKFFDARGRV